MAKITKVSAPGPQDKATIELDFQRVKSSYTVKEICQLFGLSQRFVRRWTREGVIRAIAAEDSDAEPRYDFRALSQFRRVRELRAQGMTTAQIDAELRGQLNLFQTGKGRLLELTVRRSAFEEGLVLQEQGDLRARDCYERAIREGEYRADAYCNLGILEFEAGKISKAVSCFTLSLRDEPRHLETHYNLGNLYFDAGDLHLARLHYEIGTEIEPCFSHLYFNLGLVYAQQGELEPAVAALKKCKELDPDEEPDYLDSLIGKIEQLAAAL
jgi:tetratricopeptide (TPR) repeat protein